MNSPACSENVGTLAEMMQVQRQNSQLSLAFSMQQQQRYDEMDIIS